MGSSLYEARRTAEYHESRGLPLPLNDAKRLHKLGLISDELLQKSVSAYFEGRRQKGAEAQAKRLTAEQKRSNYRSSEEFAQKRYERLQKARAEGRIGKQELKQLQSAEAKAAARQTTQQQPQQARLTEEARARAELDRQFARRQAFLAQQARQAQPSPSTPQYSGTVVGYAEMKLGRGGKPSVVTKVVTPVSRSSSSTTSYKPPPKMISPAEPGKRGQGGYASPKEFNEYLKQQQREQFKKESPLASKYFLPAERLFKKAEKKAEEVPYIFPYATAGVGAVKGAVYTLPKALHGLVRHPVRSGKGIVGAVAHPIRTMEKVGPLIKGQLDTRPTAFIGEAGGYIAGSYALGVGIKKVAEVSPKVGYRKLEVPAASGNKVIYRGIGFEYKHYGKPLVGVSQGKLAIGTPTLRGRPYIVQPGFQPQTSTATTIVAQNIKHFYTRPSTMLVEGKSISPALQQELFKRGLTFEKAYANQKSLFTEKRVILEGTERLNPKAVKSILDLSKKQKGVPYGSFPTRAQLKAGVRRPVGDIDVHFLRGDELRMAGITKKGLAGVKAAGERARIPVDSPYSIETFRSGQWVKAVEFKSPSVESVEALVPEQALGFKLGIERETTKIGGYKVAAITGESKRKLAAITATKEPGALGVAHTGRFKDLPDFFRIAKTQVESAKIAGAKPSTLAKGKSLLELQSQLGVSISTAPVKVALASSSVSASSGSSVSSLGSIVSVTLLKPKSQAQSPSTNLRKSLSPKALTSVKSYLIGKGSRSPYRSPSPRSPSALVSPRSLSPKRSKSPSTSPRPSPSPSPSPSPFPSPSGSPSPSRSPSPSASPSLSPSPSFSPSPSPSPSPSLPKGLPPPTLLSLSSFRRWKTQKLPRSDRLIKQFKKRNPTGLAAVFGIKGKRSIAGERTGLGLRPILTEKKKKGKFKLFKI